MSNLITIHLLRSLPMHNLNRGADGLPKSQMDGGIQRGRLSSQSIKRPARIAFRDALITRGEKTPSTRTREAVTLVAKMAAEHAEANGLTYDAVAGKKAITKVIVALAKAEKEKTKETKNEGETGNDNILLFATSELETLAAAVVKHQNGGPQPNADFIQDITSPALDIAAFGRMFASAAAKSTQAAVAVSHAITTHPMELTIDYFTAVDEVERRDESGNLIVGAGHLGLAYYTSGVYYSTFTIDAAQLKRSWSGFGGSSAREQVELLVESLIKALPSGKASNTAPYAAPYVVAVEQQRSRIAYEFETPVDAGRDGGYKTTSAQALAHQIGLADTFDPANIVARAVYAPDHGDLFETSLSSVTDIASFVGSLVFTDGQEAAE